MLALVSFGWKIEGIAGQLIGVVLIHLAARRNGA